MGGGLFFNGLFFFLFLLQLDSTQPQALQMAPFTATFWWGGNELLLPNLMLQLLCRLLARKKKYLVFDGVW
jgi:hypothetical protein